MSVLALMLLGLAGDAQAAPEAPPKPEIALFSRAVIVGWEISDGFGLNVELGAPGTLSDIVEASLLIPHRAVDRRTFPTTNVAAAQVQAAIDSRATLVIALDYLVPFVYADVGSDEKRVENVEAALARLSAIEVPLILGNVPDLKAASTILNPLVPPKFLPRPETLTAINQRVSVWASERTNVVIAPIAAEYAHIESGEPFGVRASAWPKSWLSEMLQKDRVHPRMHGSIAAWLLGLDALCATRKDIDPKSFDWSANSIFRKVYASKESLRRSAAAQIAEGLKALPNRPPPGPLPPRPLVDPEEEVRRKERGETDSGSEGTGETEKEKKERGRGDEEPH